MAITNIAGVINTGSNPRSLWPGVKTWWGMSYDEQDAYYKKMYDMASSDKAYELAVEETGFGLAPVKPEGEPTKYDSAKALGDTKTRMISYALGFTITKEAIDDNLYQPLIPKYTKALARSMTATKEYKGALKFANNDVLADGQPLFSASHPVLSGTQSNVLGTQAALSRAALEDVCVMIDEAKDNRGIPVKIMPRALIVAPKNKFNAKRIVESYLDPDSSNNAINPMNDYFKDGVISNPYLAGYNDDLWFVKTNAQDAFLHYVRKELELSNDNEFDTENLKVKAYERYGFGLIDFRGAFAGKVS